MGDDNVDPAGKRVAIIGTGIAGLSCGYLLTQSGYEVTLFEKLPKIGMDAHCLWVDDVDGQKMRINTPPRSFGPEYYPNLMELYRQSGVEVHPWSWSWVAFYVGSLNPFFRVERSARLFGYAIPSFVDIYHPCQTLRLLWDGYTFASASRHDLFNPSLCRLTLREYVAHLGLSQQYLYQALLPALSMVCTCSYESCLNYPAGLVMEFFAKTTTYGQFRTKHGTADAVTKLTAGIHRVHVSAIVHGVHVGSSRSGNKKPCVEYTLADGTAETDSFDHIVMATQANHTLELVRDLPPATAALLRQFKHETSRVVIHRDPVVMPTRYDMWAPMNVQILPVEDSKRGGAAFTIWMNDSFPCIKGNLFQTWNPVSKIDPASIVGKPIDFERPIMTLASLEAVVRLAKDGHQGSNGLWFCGAWNASRIPLQESGVMCALEVVRGITQREDTIVGNFTKNEIDEETYHLKSSHHDVLMSEKLYESSLSSFIPSSPSMLKLGLVISAAVGIVVHFRQRKL